MVDRFAACPMHLKSLSLLALVIVRLLRYLSTSLVVALATMPVASNASNVRVPVDGISGISRLHDSRIVTVHDIKPRTYDDKRVWLGIYSLPEQPGKTLEWRPLWTNLSEVRPQPKDIESISALPGGKSILVAESGAIGKEHQRLFELSETNGRWLVQRIFRWPWPVKNVEGMEVCTVNGRHYFVSAERAEGAVSVEIVWAQIEVKTLSFGEAQRMSYSPPMVTPGKGQRLISSLTCDEGGALFGSAAYDPGNETGPFRSVIFEVGLFQEQDGIVGLRLHKSPRSVVLEGLKVEGLVVMPQHTGSQGHALISTDDEDMGGVVRLIEFPLKGEDRF